MLKDRALETLLGTEKAQTVTIAARQFRRSGLILIKALLLIGGLGAAAWWLNEKMLDLHDAQEKENNQKRLDAIRIDISINYDDCPRGALHWAPKFHSNMR
jgi:hypothetical protein